MRLWRRREPTAEHDERFDYVVFLGRLYHLRYPNLVLDRLTERPGGGCSSSRT